MKKSFIKYYIGLVLATILFVLCVGLSLFSGDFMLMVHAMEVEQEEIQPDKTKPTLNAAVSDGRLTIHAEDTESGIQKIFVNGYKFSDLVDGTLEIRLQQFDAGYEYFTVQALDMAGNLSEEYKIGNPYYSAEEDFTAQENPAEELPVNAQPATPTEATGVVTEHIIVEPDVTDEAVIGKEFYTIQTDTGKVFYLIIEKTGQNEKVYFLTEISENDLLNVTTDNIRTLPKNSIAVESAILVADLFGNRESGDTELGSDVTGDSDAEGQPGTDEQQPTLEYSNKGAYIIMAVFAVVAVGVGYYLKVNKKKKESFEDEFDEEEEELVNEDQELEVE